TGRGDKGGHVMIQTYTPDHPCIALAAAHDYVTFAGQELAHRKEHQYPPYQRLARLIVRSEKEDAASEFAETLAGAFQLAIKRTTTGGPGYTPAADEPAVNPWMTAKAPAPVRLLGPAECPVFRLSGNYRFHFQIQSADSAVLHDVLRNVLASVRPPANVEFQVDVDPFNML
ncbi:MAG TPA: hypothetical protein VLM40_01610, partial [Gemmata sp.]|nr:hypothetical protein [Gemmata sp.]